ncbi:nitroreductase [Candidatus Rhodobacter oscarellae]|uniref:Nitroreductase n=1 Tax=Candidatus Rhodobacter oscarellae TaxID=1675527 RepID=A0A0J9E422_9RHOB|nr:nitroreductase family protein [Candidatus Rhodobacter lobularis]KMW57467.1 nitroreductase [Candidatus Rhodobacter lobularis]
MSDELNEIMRARFGEALDLAEVSDAAQAAVTGIIGRGSCRAFRAEPVSEAHLRLIAAASLSAPSKSDLQQRDVILLLDPARLARVKALLGAQEWIAKAPALMLFCANNRRQRQAHAHWGRDFANDHLDAFFNASVDAGIGLATAISAAEAMGLGCCPISTIRNHLAETRDLLGLPDHVFPVAALAIGWPVYPSPRVTPRLALDATVHVDAYRDAPIDAVLTEYEARRGGMTGAPRNPDIYGSAEPYSWSDDKTRQYGQPERADFGAFIRQIGYKLD